MDHLQICRTNLLFNLIRTSSGIRIQRPLLRFSPMMGAFSLQLRYFRYENWFETAKQLSNWINRSCKNLCHYQCKINKITKKMLRNVSLQNNTLFCLSVRLRIFNMIILCWYIKVKLGFGKKLWQLLPGL